MRNKNIFFVLVVVLFMAGLFLVKNNFSKSLEADPIQHVKIAGEIIKVESALTAEEQAQGLSGRKELKEDEGMLFVFDYPGKYPFWMKDMSFPIDIIWIGGSLQVVHIKHSALPKSYPESFAPSEKAKYVLEVVSGFSEKNGLKEGDKVEFLSY